MSYQEKIEDKEMNELRKDDSRLQRVAQIIRLNSKDEAAYIRYHEKVWPSVLATIAACNISNYSIFLRNGLLFSYFEYSGTELAADMKKMSACVDTQRWWSIMDPMQSTMPDALSGEKWSPMREVFHFDPVHATQLEMGQAKTASSEPDQL